MKTLLGLLCLSFGAAGALALPTEDDEGKKAKIPAEWRDNMRPELRKAWDALEGKPAPRIASLTHWMNTEGRSWKDYRGKVVLLDMWATWCGPCVQGIPKLEKLHEKYSKDGLVILGVHSARGYQKMEGFVKKRDLPYSFAADTDYSLGTQLGVQYIPCYFVIDRQGVMRVAGANRGKLEDIAKALLAEPYDGPTADVDHGAEPVSKGWPAHKKKKLYAENDLRGKQAPAFQVESWLTEEPSRKGKVLLIDFWATWCGPCRKAIPELNEIQKEFADDLVVIGISDEDADTVRDFMGDTEMAYAQALDPKKRMSSAVGVKGIPHVLIVDTSGIVRWQGFPLDKGDPLTADVVRQVIAADKSLRQ